MSETGNINGLETSLFSRVKISVLSLLAANFGKVQVVGSRWLFFFHRIFGYFMLSQIVTELVALSS